MLDFLAPPFASRQKVEEKINIKVNLGQGDCFVANEIFGTVDVMAPRNDDAFFV